MTVARPRAYLAGPEVFLSDRMAVFAAKSALCERYGIEAVPPMDAAHQAASDAPLSRRIYLRNVQLMDAVDLIIANLTPYQGPSADVGTVFELGYGVARGLPVFGYSNDARDFFTRASALVAPVSAGADGRIYGRDGHALEDFGLADNLMIDESLQPFGGVFKSDHGEPSPLTDLAHFERCVAFAASYMGGGAASGSRSRSGTAIDQLA